MQKQGVRLPFRERGTAFQHYREDQTDPLSYNELIRRDATPPWPRGSQRRWKCLRRNKGDMLPPPVWSFLQIISGRRAGLIRVVPPSCTARSSLSLLLTRTLFFTPRPSANEKRQPRRASAFWHLFMLTGQLKTDMKISPGLIKMQMCENTFCMCVSVCFFSLHFYHITANKYFDASLFLAAYFNENFGKEFYLFLV